MATLSPSLPRASAGLLVLLLTALTACGEGAEGRSGDALAEDHLQTSGAGEKLLPLPRPTGERQIGARLREYTIDLTRDTVPAGEIEFHVVNSGTTTHFLLVRNQTTYAPTPHLPPGDSAVLRVELVPGEYQVVCLIRDEFDHLGEGMRRTLVVTQ
jgi:hypothetical protein